MTSKTDFPLVILAGGQGSRLKKIHSDLPKILKPIGEKVFLDYFLENLFRLGFKNLIFIIQDDNQKIYESLIAKNNERFFIDIFSDGKNKLGTAGAIVNNLELLPQYFCITYGDTLLNIDIESMENKFINSDKDILISVLESKDLNHMPNLLIKDKIEAYSKVDNEGFNFIEYGLMLANKKVFSEYKKKENIDLKNIFENTINMETINYQETKSRFYEIGSLDSYAELNEELKKINSIHELWNE